MQLENENAVAAAVSESNVFFMVSFGFGFGLFWDGCIYFSFVDYVLILNFVS